eukprot:3833909-Karenia_brevis.AAC.1
MSEKVEENTENDTPIDQEALDAEAENTEDTAIVNIINDRWVQKTFPVTYPRDVLPEHTNFAQHTMSLVA